MYNPKMMLITGGSGFIGSNYIEHVLENDPAIEIINYDLLTYAANVGFSEEIMQKYPDRYKFIQGDICDELLLSEVFSEHNIDTVVHFAAESHVDNSLENPDIFLQTNIMGTNALLKVSLQFWKERYGLDASKCRFHHISTDEVYGTLTLEQTDIFTEQSPYQPNSPYSASKASSDHLVRCYFESFNLPITMTNTSNNFGPRQHGEKFIPTIIRSCFNKESIPVYGEGKNVRDWIFVKDHCVMIHKVIQKGKVGESYNIGGDNEVANIDLCRTISSLMHQFGDNNFDYQQLIAFVKDRAGHDLRYAINMDKYRKNIGSLTHTPFGQALRTTIEYNLGLLNKDVLT
jgi:dTDP-glucose 4,6-dehydratase